MTLGDLDKSSSGGTYGISEPLRMKSGISEPLRRKSDHGRWQWPKLLAFRAEHRITLEHHIDGSAPSVRLVSGNAQRHFEFPPFTCALPNVDL